MSERVVTEPGPYTTVTLSFVSQTEAKLTQPLSLRHSIVVAVVAACCDLDPVNDRQKANLYCRQPTNTVKEGSSHYGLKHLDPLLRFSIFYSER